MCFEFVEKHDLSEFTKELMWQKLFHEARSRIVPNFWFTFTAKNKTAENFADSIKILHAEIRRQQPYFSLLDLLSEDSKLKSYDHYKENLSAILLSQIPPQFECCVNSFYSQGFRAFMSLEKRNCNYGNLIDIPFFCMEIT